MISKNPRKIVKTTLPKIEENQAANITLFDPKKTWTYLEKDISSISKNTPFINYEFTGKVLGIINNGQIQIHN